MNLDNARNTKFEIFRKILCFEELQSHAFASDSQPLFTLPLKERLKQINEPRNRHLKDFDARALISVGITKLNGQGPQADFGLALFCQSQAAAQHSIVERANRLARGELKLFRIGPVIKHVPSRWSPARTRPLRLGSSVSHFRSTAGTLGCFVDRGVNGGLCLLSNNHVLARNNDANLGDSIVQPGKRDGGRDPMDRVATLTHFVPLDLDSGGSNFLDAAVASVPEGINTEPSELYNPQTQAVMGKINAAPHTDPYPGLQVQKVGRTTGYTDGEVVAVEIDNLQVTMANGGYRQIAVFDGQMTFGNTTKAFSKPGDSGSVIWDEGFNPVALLFAGTKRSKQGFFSLTFGTPIQVVLSALKCRIYS